MRIYVNSMLNAVKLTVSSWDAAVNSGWNICVNEEYNTDPNLTPWVGIYSPSIFFEPRRSNIQTPFMANVRLPVYVQESDFKQPFNAIKLLEDLAGEVYTAVSCYRDLHNTVNIVTGIEWDPFNRIVDDEDVIVANELIIIAEVFA